MRRLIACLAVSADGFLARRDGDIDWLNHPEPPGGYGMGGFMRSIDTIVPHAARSDASNDLVGPKLRPRHETHETSFPRGKRHTMAVPYH